jgi:hypothetical protein
MPTLKFNRATIRVQRHSSRAMQHAKLNGMFKTKRARSPRKLEPHEVIARLKARKAT